MKDHSLLNTDTITTKSEKLLEALLDQATINLIKDPDLLLTERHGAWDCPKCGELVSDLGKLRQRIKPWRQKKRIIILCERCDIDRYSDEHFRLVGDLLAPLRLSIVGGYLKEQNDGA